MRIAIIAVGKIKSGPMSDLFSHYEARLTTAGRQIGIASVSTFELPESRASSVVQRKREEAEAIDRKIGDGSRRIVLDETGTHLTSEALADSIAGWRDAGSANLAFVIGGADGIDAELRRSADLVLAFGRMTLPHQLARIVLAEQLYRSATIIAGHPYHRS
ncbi:MAG: 23S rRNA (pseudouridine(1915)-N(3))-methyltransferase RlmH [Pseudomonadota bacterium]